MKYNGWRMIKKYIEIIKKIIRKLVKKFSGSNAFVVAIYLCAIVLPRGKVRNYERHTILLGMCEKVFGQMRHALNNKTWSQRETIAIKYIVPTINKLFDKNYVNFAQLLLLTLEEYFLSKDTEEDFEEVLSTFSSHAIAAGLRCREKFPLDCEKKIQYQM